MTRAAVTVFIETDHEGDAVDASFLFQRALRQAVGDTLTIHPHNWPKPITITVHSVCETGVAAANGYLWIQPTNKGFPRKETSEEEL